MWFLFVQASKVQLDCWVARRLLIDDDEIEAKLKAKMLDIRRQQFIGMQDILDDDDDFEDWIIVAYTGFIVVSSYALSCMF